MLNKTPLTAFGEICHRGTEMVYNIPHTRRPGSALFQTVSLERQSLYKLNKIRRLRYVTRSASPTCIDLDDLKILAALIRTTKGQALQSVEEVTVSYNPLLPVRDVTWESIWSTCIGLDRERDDVKDLFQSKDGLGCLENWTVVRRMWYDSKLMGGPWSPFERLLRVHEVQLVFRKSQPVSAVENPEWVELAGWRSLGE
ncbi:hypothetical protein Z517_00470 [Fonsecaea pedrosoi CBS 271.37]|uniref:Uncharacterized protein n=1 Tax=Fonsecaea pedrosoi CBS 271.37 TaxID=1442368 RepID=A0A0D2FEM7_9EURO|nr:uncharacterized protein Z517_00470 [Fonsecaea pedrosoi CBS 271.37]KIW85082.1 hypothetical protein Z517_00470 [Fonsecaea pedrosoi CBS 271.37]